MGFCAPSMATSRAVLTVRLSLCHSHRKGGKGVGMKPTSAMHVAAAAILLAGGIWAKEFTVETGGSKVVIRLTPINRMITESDMTKGSQSNAVSCAFLFYSQLAKGDIATAATFASDPTAMADRYQQLLKESGTDAFQQQAKAFFTSKTLIMGSVEIGDETMLIIKSAQGELAQYYRKKAGKFFVIDTPAARKQFQTTMVQIMAGNLAF